MAGGGRRCGPTQDKDCNRSVNQTEDFELYSPSRFGQLNLPLYKPELWDKIQELDMWTNKFDPVMTCQPLGVPRQGPPRRIYQSENDVTFLYFGGDAGGGYGEYRIIPTDDRARDKNAEFDITYMGIRWDAGRATRSCSTPSRSSIRRGSGAAGSSIPIACMSSRNSGVRAMRSCTTSRSKTRRCCWSRGCSRHGRCGATRIPTRAFCENEATARRFRDRSGGFADSALE